MNKGQGTSMNILFLSIGKLDDLSLKALYPDLVRALAKNNNVYVVTCVEKRCGQPTTYSEECGCNVLRVRTGNITYTNLIKKAFNMFALEYQFLNAIDKYIKGVKFDLVIYSTPPINFEKIVKKIKKRDNAKSYLLLKDIFPQNAVDLQMFSKSSPIYSYYRQKEKNLYKVSDYIGCMSQGNVDYVLKHNPHICPETVEVCPNSVEVLETKQSNINEVILQRYQIPKDKVKFIYGGNLGKPQGINFLLQVLKEMQKDPRAFFVIIGSGTEFNKLDSFIKTEELSNVCLIKELPRDDYQQIAEACDIGMVFLDKRFTIPNIPSRILSYMQASKPVLAVTDEVTDLKDIIADGQFGWWASSDNLAMTIDQFDKILSDVSKISVAGINGKKYLAEHFTSQHSADIILKHFNQ